MPGGNRFNFTNMHAKARTIATKAALKSEMDLHVMKMIDQIEGSKKCNTILMAHVSQMATQFNQVTVVKKLHSAKYTRMDKLLAQLQPATGLTVDQYTGIITAMLALEGVAIRNVP